MTREDIKAIADIVHKTIYGFFDVCGDDEETPMTDKDKLLLKVNKAICNNIKTLEQEPYGDAISREAVLSLPRNRTYKLTGVSKNESIDVDLIEALPSVTPEPKMGYWIDQYNDGDWHCSKCGTIVEKDEQINHNWYFCYHCGCRMVEPQESEVTDADSD